VKRIRRKELGIGGLLAALCALGALLNPHFFSPENLANLARQLGLFGTFGLGVAVVIMTGGIELSVGSMLALVGVLLTMLLRETDLPAWTALAAAPAAGLVLGSLHGLLITRLRLQPFIVTLCGLLLYRGLARYVARDETKGFGNCEGFEWLRALATGSWLSLPAPFWALLGVALALWLLLEKTVYGRYLLATGANETAARYAGIRTRLVVLGAYQICGALTGVSALLIAFYTNSVAPSVHGSFYELYGIAAAVLGGCSLRGGEGSVLGALLGTAVILIIQNLVNLMGIPTSLNFAVMGGVILFGVVVDQLWSRDRSG
jgi:ribose transport system permease protein